ncbi:MAG: choice-of-anchor B family protein [Planctomycetes bacterium]|nr:choice-of-anchor B family protein [Planctomycetota bacterium]
MHHFVLRYRLALILVSTAFIIPIPVLGHPDEDLSEALDPAIEAQHNHDAEPAYPGPGWSSGQGGQPGVTFPANGVQLLSWLTVTDFGSQNTSGSTVEGYVSPSGREYALMGISCGTGFVDVTDPTNPVIVGFVAGPCSLWRDIRTYQDHAYAVSEGGEGVQIIDLSQIDAGIVTYEGRITAPNAHQISSHTIEVNQQSGYLYRCGGGSTKGVKIYSLANPAAPAHVNTIFATRYVHECQVVTYDSGTYAGREIAFMYNDTGSGGGTPSLGIIDVTDKMNPIEMSNYQYPGGGFSHQGWLSTDRQYVFLDDEFDENNLGIPTTTHVISVSNLSNPVQVATFTNGSPSIDHNQYVKGSRLFQSNYRSGLRIWDVTNPTSPTEMAWFDTYPDNDSPNYNSLWDNYPYLPSGIILGSDIEKGLFIWCADPRGDMDHDGRVTVTDIPLFVADLLSDTPPVRACGGADMNNDIAVDGLDLAGFVAALVSP